MQAFNIATQPIRDALKNLEGLTLPSVNIMAWLAQNVVSEVDLDKGEDGGEDVKFKVVLGGEEKDQLELARLQEAQRSAAPSNQTDRLTLQSTKRLARLAHSFHSHWHRDISRSG